MGDPRNPIPDEDDPLSRDYFYRRRVIVRQKKKGYRFSLDAPLLADFLPPSPGPVLEVGCGSGIISLLALYRRKFSKVTAVEIQPGMAAIARENACLNGMEERLQVVCADFRTMDLKSGSFEMIFANPPFEPMGKGRLSRLEEIRLAKFEVTLTIAALLDRASILLTPTGRVYFIHPHSRWAEIQELTLRLGLHMVQWRVVRPFPDSPPDRVLVGLGKAPGTGMELTPLTVFTEPGQYSDELERILSGVDHD